MQNILLSISLLVSNRIDTIRKCMESIKPILDAVQSELIAVDTGCTDGSIKVVEEYADKIVKFKWCDDFSAARNTGLKEARGEWFMFIDDDEWFEDATEIIEFFNSGEYKSYGRASYLVRNYADLEGMRYGDYYAGRLTKRTEEVAFTGRVHEHFEPSYEPVKHFTCFAHHYGYARANGDSANRAERNIKLALKEIENNPKDFRMYAQLVQEYKSDGQTDKALEVCERVFELCRTVDARNTGNLDMFAEWIIASWIRMYDIDDSKAALETAQRIEKNIELGAVGCMLHCAACFVAAQRAQKYELVVDYAEAYLEAVKVVTRLNDKEGQLLADSRDFIKDSFREDVVCGMLTACVLCGEKERLLAYREQYGRHDNTLIRDIVFREAEAAFYWEELELNVFEQNITELIKGYGYKAVKYKYEQIKAGIISIRPEFAYFVEMKLLEGELSEVKDSYEAGKWQGRRVRELLYSYAETIINYYGCVYAEQQFEPEKRKNLPRVCRFALLIDEARVARMTGDSIRELRCMKDAAKLYFPLLLLMNELIKNYMADVEYEMKCLESLKQPDMKRMQKKQVEEFLSLLSQAHQELVKAAAEKKADEALELLEQCHQGAIEAGTLIEKMEGLGFVTVGLLEEYCGLVYHFHEEIINSQRVDIKKLYAELNGQLIKIKGSVKNDIKTRQEVVFLPYKASMWDSLESVWKAAVEDEDCDAYVIPIPYYDKNPDRSFGKLYYEGDLYPEYVPVVDYRDYDFESRRPDIIFIHNPYDSYNFVTSVEPYFYSDNLKSFTEKLVYIPYFVLAEIDPDNKEAVKEVKHFCLMPVMKNADRVIVQSENYKQIYVNVLSEEFGEQTREKWEEKILPLGSPKFDKVAASVEIGVEQSDIPKEWKKIIYKPDGTRKKVVFYNTGLATVNIYDRNALVKIKDVLWTFKEQKDEVALLWRPHPLMESTIKSMHPHLWQEYSEIVASYKSEGWGIYDDTPDMNRAIALSDAYYGDGSSIVQLFEKVGKPVMIQNVEMVEE